MTCGTGDGAAPCAPLSTRRKLMMTLSPGREGGKDRLWGLEAPSRSGGQRDLRLWKQATGYHSSEVTVCFRRDGLLSEGWIVGMNSRGQVCSHPQRLVLGENSSTRAPICRWRPAASSAAKPTRPTVPDQPIPEGSLEETSVPENSPGTAVATAKSLSGSSLQKVLEL